MQLFQTIRSTLHDPAFYAQARTQALFGPIKLYGLVALVYAAVIAVWMFVGIVAFVSSDVLTSIENSYPDELVLTIVDGNASINQPEPYYVKNTFEDTPENIAVIDTQGALSGDDLETYSTYILVKKTYLISGESNQQRIASFATMKGTTTIDKSRVVGIVEKIRPYFRTMGTIGAALLCFVAAFVIALFMTVFHLLYVLVPACAVFLYALLRRQTMPFKESYIVALYASIPVAIVSFLCMQIGLWWPPFAYTLLVLLIALTNLAGVEKK